MAALACYDKAALTPSAYKAKIISVAAGPLVLKRKNHSWRPVRENAPLEKFGYILGERIGEGPYSKIQLAYNPKEEEHAAVKVITKDKIPRKIFEKFIKREIYIMQQFQHPHIIGVNEVVESKNHIYIVMEYAQNGDLLQYVNQAGVLPEAEARRLFRQIIAAVKVLHEAKVVHRDIKLDNILLDEDNNVKLADFGFARLQYSYELSKTFCGSYAYAAPEILDGEDYDGKLADVWSLGVCLYGMLHGRVPFHEEDVDILRQSMDGEIHFNAGVTKECSDLIRSMLRVDRSQRVSLADIVASPWMTMPLVTIPEDDDHDDDLDSTWSIISRREPSEASGSVSNSTVSSQGVRIVEVN
ncbi:testis-specific serine/threonine-protein kinase 3-like [Lineus longissimus]|uniref:testis-specific serine/threonine-protein kinase 3-like n=1 Tax=Lineus longissimus TaxID=88925 RepID=UPI00315DE406